MLTTTLLHIPVGVLVQCEPARSPWLDWLWRPVAVLAGVPLTPPWTVVSRRAGATTFYAGSAVIELHRADTEPYRDNLACGRPSLWVVLRFGTGRHGPELLSVTGDPATGEALTGAGTDVVETVPMPCWIREYFAAFVAEHYVNRPTYRRERDRPGAKEYTP